MPDLKDIEEVGESTPFGPNSEKAIISLAFDHPDFFSSIARNLSHRYFRLSETQFVMAIIETLHKKKGYVPPRHIVRDYVLKHLSVDDDYQPILEIVDRESNPREIPFLKEELVNWARDAAYGLLYDEEALSAYENKDYQRLEEIFDEAQRITDISAEGLWFFNEIDALFERDLTPSFTCGFQKIDACIEGGGPSKGEVFCWMAPTGVGKCHTLSTKMLEEKLSNIYEIEILINGQTKIVKLAGFREIETKRGAIKVCDLTEEDDIVKIPTIQDKGDICLPDL